MPSMPRIPSISYSHPVLPLSTATPPDTPSRRFRSTSRRLSYTIKNRAGKHAYALSISGFLAIIFLVYTWSAVPQYPHRISRTNGGKLHLYTRNQHPLIKEMKGEPVEGNNGVSVLTQTEDELIAEDDLFWQSYTEPTPLSAEEVAAQQEIQAHREDVQEQDTKHTMSALIWWLAEGGVFPRAFPIPSKNELKKMGPKGLERMLDDIEMSYDGESFYPEGWADYAKKQYKIVLFSKSYCPFSKKAKKILENYRLTPAPFVIELDHRSDMEQLQTLLQRLTGRRTVPNVFLDFQSIGGSDELTLFHAEGGLQRQLEDMAVLPGYRRRQSAPRVPKPMEPVERADKDKKRNHAKPAVQGILAAHNDGPVFGATAEEDDDAQDGVVSHEPDWDEETESDYDEDTEPNYDEGTDLDDGVDANDDGTDEDAEEEDESEVDPNAPIDFAAAIKAAHEKVDYVQGMGEWDGYEPLDDDPNEGAMPPQEKAQKGKGKQNKALAVDNKKIANLPAEQVIVKDETTDLPESTGTATATATDTDPATTALTAESEPTAPVEEEQDELTRLRARLAQLEALALQSPVTPSAPGVETTKDVESVSGVETTDEAEPAATPATATATEATAVDAPAVPVRRVDQQRAKLEAAKAKARADNEARVEQARQRVEAVKAQAKVAVPAPEKPVEKKAEKKVVEDAKKEVKKGKVNEVIYQKAPQPRYPQKNGAAALAAAAKWRRAPVKKGRVVG